MNRLIKDSYKFKASYVISFSASVMAFYGRQLEENVKREKKSDYIFKRFYYLSN